MSTEKIRKIQNDTNDAVSATSATAHLDTVAVQDVFLAPPTNVDAHTTPDRSEMTTGTSSRPALLDPYSTPCQLMVPDRTGIGRVVNARDLASEIQELLNSSQTDIKCVFKSLNDPVPGTNVQYVCQSTDQTESAVQLHRRRSSAAMGEMNESYVIVLYTGGTIGMKSVRTDNDEVYRPEKNYMTNALRSIPHLNDAEYVKDNFAQTCDPPCCLPPIRHCRRRIVYWLLEYDPLLDSANITFDDWIRLAKDIKKLYSLADGFVVLHGTDTLAYTASALSFMLCNLGKPVVVTGAQIPVAEVRSDGRENMIGALIVAGAYDIPEVCVYFNNSLLRGNRVTKMDNSALNAFQSPNCPPLATMEIDINVNYDQIFRQSEELVPFYLHTNLCRNVGLIMFTPSITLEMVRSVLAQSDGVVRQSCRCAL